MEQFAPYAHTLASIVLVALLALIIGPLTAVRKQAAGLNAGASPDADYADPAYRFHRAHANLTENYGMFVGLAVAAMFAGVAPFWVNLLASIYLVARVAVLIVHIKGIGQQHAGPRSFVYVAGWLTNIVLGVMTLWAVLM